jgi:hypothetical protein
MDRAQANERHHDARRPTLFIARRMMKTTQRHARYVHTRARMSLRPTSFKTKTHARRA